MSAARTATDYRTLLATQDWGVLRQKLKLFAWSATGRRSMERAEDLAQDAIARVWEDAGVRWDPAVEPSLFRFLTGILRGDLSNQRRLKRTSRETLPGKDVLEAQADANATAEAPEELLIRRETTQRVFDAILARGPDDEIGSAIVALFARGIDRAAEQAEASGCSIDEIQRARRRVFDRAAAVKRELGEEDEAT